jgi:Right handed beta helix region
MDLSCQKRKQSEVCLSPATRELIRGISRKCLQSPAMGLIRKDQGVCMRNRLPFLFLSALRGLAVVLAMALPGHTADWYVAPLDKPPAKAAPSGSKGDPFATVAKALASGKVKGGDRILLMSGPHGALMIDKTPAFSQQVTIMSETGRTAQLDSVEVRNASNIRLLSLSVWPSNPSTTTSGKWLVLTAESTADIVVQNLVIRSEKGEVDKFANWSRDAWLKHPFNGIFLLGPRSSAVGNNLAGIAFGIALSGNGSRAINNVVDFYSGDGLRGLGNHNVFRGNRVVNCITVSDNHADGFQSWAGPSGKVVGLVIDRNVIIEWTYARKDHPFRCQLQGIGLFDGFYDDLTITNNLVTTTQFHGISVYGARNAIVANNTVANTNNLTGGDPFLAVVNHKNGTPSSNVIVSNNLAMKFVDENRPGSTVVFRKNSVIGTPGAVFRNPSALDYRPKSTSGFIDTGDAASATSIDLLGNPRPSGAGPDRGAYEVVVGGAAATP